MDNSLSKTYSLCGGDFAGEDFRDPKVSNLEDTSGSVHHDVLSLEVTMENV